MRPALLPVEIEYGRIIHRRKDGEIDRIADCLGDIAYRGGGSFGDPKTSPLAELTSSDLRGFGAFPTHMETGVYGTELESTLRRQSLSSKPEIWNDGIRTPITERIAKGASSVTWGCPSTSSDEDIALLLGVSSDGQMVISLIIARAIPGAIPDQKGRRLSTCSPKAPSASPGVFAAIYGQGHLISMLKSARNLVQLHGDRPKVFSLDFVVDFWGRMNFDFVYTCVEWLRRIIAIAPTGKKAKIDRISWRPRPGGTDTFDIAPIRLSGAHLHPGDGKKMASQTIPNALGKRQPPADAPNGFKKTTNGRRGHLKGCVSRWETVTRY